MKKIILSFILFGTPLLTIAMHGSRELSCSSFQCSGCSRTFPTYQETSTHRCNKKNAHVMYVTQNPLMFMRALQKQEAIYQIQCSVCQKQFATKDTCFTHINTATPCHRKQATVKYILNAATRTQLARSLQNK